MIFNTPCLFRAFGASIFPAKTNFWLILSVGIAVSFKDSSLDYMKKINKGK
ncbi:hypothetical protein LguiA_024396 [Lonicera macranthoides]